MRVKRLEVHGFKSFKDKTVIQFDHDITGIVGPNGCGKSNIVDAFFWVMGEQSYKHIRGSGSDDLIFNGSAKHTPSGVAEATLVLETPEIDTENAPVGATASADTEDLPKKRMKEIAVTRRVYRGGEGEYFINGIPSRLRDIKELFMDTGVGAKGYSVIEQGQIGKIVNSKPEERRKLVEEAAGIAKYKARKQESLRKMESAQANLERLNDVVAEIERGLRSLERQASRARRYQEYKKDLIEKETVWSRRKARILRQKLEQLEIQKKLLQQEVLDIKAERDAMEKGLESDRQGQIDDQGVSDQLSGEIQAHSDELTRERSALELSRNRQADLESQISRMQAESSELKEAIATESQKIDGYQQELSESDQKLGGAREEVESLAARAKEAREAALSFRSRLEDLKQELMRGISESSDLKSRSAALKEKIESLEQRIATLDEEYRHLSQDLGNQRSQLQDLETKSAELAKQVEKKQTEEFEARALVERAEVQLNDLRIQRDQANKSFTQVVSKLESLKELAEAFEGVSDGPKALMDWAREQQHQDLFGLVADHYTARSGYEAVLERWLGSRLEQIVCSDSQIALEALTYLNEAQSGMATVRMSFGASHTQRPARSLEDLKSHLAGLGIEVEGELAEFCAIKSEQGQDFEVSARQMISHVAVVASWAPLKEWLQREGFKDCLEQLAGWSLASKDAWILDASGFISGGHGSESGAGLLARKRSIVDLTEKVIERRAVRDQLDITLGGVEGDLYRQRENLEEIQGQLKELDIQHSVLSRDVVQQKKSLEERERNHSKLQDEVTELRAALENSRQSRDEISQQSSEILSRQSDIENQLQGQDEELTSLESARSAAEDALQQARIDLAAVQERHSGLQREINAIQVFIESRKRRVAELEGILSRVTEERSQFAGKDGGREDQINELTEKLGLLREQLSEVRTRLEQRNAKVNQALDQIREMHERLDSKSQETNQVVVDRERMQSEMEHLTKSMEEKYGPGCLDENSDNVAQVPEQEEMSDPVVTQEMSEAEEKILSEEVEDLRDKIRKLGDVNPMAVEEYEELKKRHDHLIGERSDLEGSIDNLNEAIEHINNTSKERFVRAFEAISERFERLFPIIFGGGSAKLTLLYPEGSEDVLECGVDILARPPGKKIQNIGLLSGGEKALTALSLIFAIFMVKPSPFCILDEVDAPLDDANVGRFNALLAEMAMKTQFILITHNKKTMELNDTLYGVTMEDPGVSKMVSIELN